MKDMRVRLLKFNPKFFSLEDMPSESMGPPTSARASESDSSDGLRVHPNFVLTLWYTLHQLRDEKSFWRPYLDLLPKRIPTPLFWSEAELEMVKGTNLYEGVQQLHSLLRKVWNTLRRVDEAANYSIEEVQYGWTLFSSRAFTVSTDTTKEEVHTHILKWNQQDTSSLVEPCLVPFADIFNHCTNAHVQYRTNNNTNTFNLDLETLAQDGQEIFNNYGLKSNEALIIGYGFAILDTGRQSGTSLSTQSGEEISKVIHQSNPNNTYWVQLNIDAGHVSLRGFPSFVSALPLVLMLGLTKMRAKNCIA